MYIFHRRKYITKYNIKIIEKYLTYNYFFYFYPIRSVISCKYQFGYNISSYLRQCVYVTSNLHYVMHELLAY